MCFIYRNNHQQMHTKTNNNHQQSPKKNIYKYIYIYIFTRIIKKYLHIPGPQNQTFPPRPRLEMGTRKPNLCRSRRWKVLRRQTDPAIGRMLSFFFEIPMCFPYHDSTVLQIYQNSLTTCHIPNVVVLVFLIAPLKCLGFQIPLQTHFVADSVCTTVGRGRTGKQILQQDSGL